MNTIKVKIVFQSPISGRVQRETITGIEVPMKAIRSGDLTRRIKETEEHLSRITGLIVQIRTGDEV